MSAETTLKQSAHTLQLLADLGLDKEGMKKLHDGYLADLAKAIVNGTVPSRARLLEVLCITDKVTIGRDLWSVIKSNEAFSILDRQLIDKQNLCRPKKITTVKVEWKVAPWELSTSMLEDSDYMCTFRDKDGWAFATIDHLLAFGARADIAGRTIYGMGSRTFIEKYSSFHAPAIHSFPDERGTVNIGSGCMLTHAMKHGLCLSYRELR